MPLFLQFVLALLIAAVSIRPLARLAPRLGLTDAPGPRKVHDTPIPRVGGIAMALGIFVPLLLTQSITGPLAGFLAGALTLLVFGVWDDRADLGYRIKFTGQIAAVLLCMWLGDVRIDSWTLGQREPLPPLFGDVLTFVFLVGVTNAVNLSDGLDGLAGGMALLCLFAIALLAAISGNATVVAVALIECGAILGFLRFNTHPAQIFMGDSGSQLLGLPILDTLSVMVQRIRAGRSPFSSDRNHLHHKLLGLGFAHAEAVAVVYLLQVTLFLVAYFLRFESDLVILGLFLGFAAVALSALRWAGATAWRAHSGRALPLVSRVIVWLRGAPHDLIVEATLWVMGLGIVAYAGATIATAGNVSIDLGLLCAALLFALAVSAWRKASSISWLERVVAYIAVVLIVYLDQTSPAQGEAWDMLRWTLVGVVGAAALVRFAFSGARSFEITSLDMLVVFVAVIVPLLPGPVRLPAILTGGIAKTIVLLYAVELLLGADLRRPVPRTILALTFAAVAVRGFLVFAA